MKKLLFSLILIITVTIAGLMTHSAYQKFKNSKLSALQLANVEALAQDVENNVFECLGQYDVWGSVLSYTNEYHGVFIVDINGCITIEGKSFFVGGKVGSKVYKTFFKADCKTPSPDVCCDETKIGDIKVI